MLYWEIIYVGSQIDTKRINKLCVQHLEISYIRLFLPLGCNGLKLCYTIQLVDAV
jgi:hypothetical protein